MIRETRIDGHILGDDFVIENSLFRWDTDKRDISLLFPSEDASKPKGQIIVRNCAVIPLEEYEELKKLKEQDLRIVS